MLGHTHPESSRAGGDLKDSRRWSLDRVLGTQIQRALPEQGLWRRCPPWSHFQPQPFCDSATTDWEWRWISHFFWSVILRNLQWHIALIVRQQHFISNLNISDFYFQQLNLKLVFFAQTQRWVTWVSLQEKRKLIGAISDCEMLI